MGENGPAGTEVGAEGAPGTRQQLPAARERPTEERAIPRSPQAPRVPTTCGKAMWDQLGGTRHPFPCAASGETKEHLEKAKCF